MSYLNLLMGGGRSYSNIVFLGDSVTTGRLAGTGIATWDTVGYVALSRIAAQHAAAGANRGEGMVPTYRSDRWTKVGTWTLSSVYGPYAAFKPSAVQTGGAMKSSVAASTLTATIIGSDYDVYWVEDSTTAAFTVQIDSETAVTLGGSNPTPRFMKANVASTVASGAHNVKITSPASGAVIVWGVSGNTAATGPHLHQMGLQSTAAIDCAGDGGSGQLTGWLNSLAPDLTVLAFGINDYGEQLTVASFTTNMTTLINAAKAAGSAVAIIAGNAILQNTSPAQSLYVAALASLAASTGAAFYVDIFTRWGGTEAAAAALGFMDAGGVHPNTAGHADMAVAVKAALPVSYTAPALETFGIATVPDSDFDGATLADLGYSTGGLVRQMADSRPSTRLAIAASTPHPSLYANNHFPLGALRSTSAGQGELTCTGWNVFSSKTAFTAFAIYCANTVATWDVLGVSTFALLIRPRATGIDIIVGVDATTFGHIAFAGDTNKHALRIQYDGSQATNALKLRVWLDGVAQTLTFTGTIPSSLSAGGNLNLGAQQNFSESDLARFLAYATSPLSDADAATVDAALRTKYGI